MMENDSYTPYPEQPEQTTQPAPPPPVQATQPTAIPPQPIPERPQFIADPPSQSPNPKRSLVPKILGAIGILVLVLLGIVAGYLLRDQTSNKTVTHSNISQTDTPHTVAAIGYPEKTTLSATTELALPSSLQAIATPSTKDNPGVISQFSSSPNDEMGHWNIGAADVFNSGQTGELSLINLVRDTWFAIPTPKNFHPTKSSPGYELQIANTPYSKASAIKNYSTRIADCASDPKTGVTISGFLDVCVTPKVITHTDSTFTTQAVIEGYGKTTDVEFILLGTINLESAKQLTPKAQQKLASDYKKSLEEAVKNSAQPAMPGYAMTAAATIRDALATSTIQFDNSAQPK